MSLPAIKHNLDNRISGLVMTADLINSTNHVLIYLGDDGQLLSEQSDADIGSHLVLHHPYRHRSKREIYGNVLQERSAIIVRYKSFL